MNEELIDDEALVEQLYDQADRRHGSIGSLRSLEWRAGGRIEALTAENFKLAAGSCDVDGGKVGDEHGHSYCTLQAKVEALTAENEALKKSGRALLNAKHKEAAEAKLWFEKGQALTAENEQLRKALGAAPLIRAQEGLAAFKSRQDEWLRTEYYPHLKEKT